MGLDSAITLEVHVNVLISLHKTLIVLKLQVVLSDDQSGFCCVLAQNDTKLSQSLLSQMLKLVQYHQHAIA